MIEQVVMEYEKTIQSLENNSLPILDLLPVHHREQSTREGDEVRVCRDHESAAECPRSEAYGPRIKYRPIPYMTWKRSLTTRVLGAKGMIL